MTYFILRLFPAKDQRQYICKECQKQCEPQEKKNEKKGGEIAGTHN